MDASRDFLIVRPKSRVYDYIINKDWQGHPLGSLDSWPKSLIHTVDCLLASPNPMLALWGKDHLWQFYNDAYHELFGPGSSETFAVGQSAHLPQHCNWTDLEEVAPKVFAENVHCQQLVRPRSDYANLNKEDCFHFNFSPVWDTDGSVSGILACGNISKPDTASKPFKIVDHCKKHMAMAILSGKELTLDFVSEKMMQYWGITRDQIGVELSQAVPTLQSADYYQSLVGIFEHKDAVRAPHQIVSFDKDGQQVRKYVDFCFDPCLDDHGAVSDVIVTATDVTYKVAAKRKIRHRESENFDFTQRLEVALEAGNLGFFELFISTGKMSCNEQCKANFGFDASKEFTLEGLVDCIMEQDREAMQQAVSNAINTKTDYHAQYRAVWPDQSIHWIAASGRTLYSPEGKPVKMVGVTREITQEKTRQQQLEDLVNERTQELTTSNQKLVNANQRVSESVKELSRSNANLEGFAYTASHDLQEPLRKIQAFGSLLKQKLIVAGIDNETIDLTERMQAAGQRMSVLITGLLDLSRLSVQHKMVPVNLNEAVQLAMDALELKISETSAVIQVDNLNIVHGDLSQLTQLFQNLIGNSLRFISPDRQPIISISCNPVLASDIATELLPARVADFYHQIVVSDNGIGFDPKHAEKIFVVFQRLHGRNSYEGTGIGLSICKQVVDNHHGIIYASGQEGVGASFTMLLPMAGTNVIT